MNKVGYKLLLCSHFYFSFLLASTISVHNFQYSDIFLTGGSVGSDATDVTKMVILHKKKVFYIKKTRQ